jgi:putative spermidine/putrescine transport system substrate-binding protein
MMAVLAAVALAGCREQAAETPSPSTTTPLESMSWDQVASAARGTTVRMAMWDGDPLINAYMRDYVKPSLENEYGVTLETGGGQTGSLVSRIMVDREAGRETGDVDIAWINGESFYQLRQIDALYGPFTERLPNNRYLDWESPFVNKDFQFPVAGYECPWGNVQLAIIYHSERVPDPPRTKDALAAWVKAHPGRFTFDNSFTGMTFLKCLLYEFGGGRESFNGPMNEDIYQSASERLWAYLRELKPSLWRKGETFPEGVAQLHQLLANNEVDFSMSNNDGEVDNKVTQGILPEASKAYVLDGGTIRNTHYLGILANAPNKAGAMVVVNFMISLEAQLKKATPAVWGDGTVLSTDKLPPEWQEKFRSIEGRSRVPPRDELEKNALMEPVPEIMTRLHDDFRKKILESSN